MAMDTCRMYEAKFPEVDDFVMVNVRHIAEMGAYVRLLEYNNIEGMILLSELTRKRIRSIQKLIRVGRNEVVLVLRVDKEKGYIDLSKRRVTPEDIQKCEEKYQKSKTVHSIMRQVAETQDMSVEELYTNVGWPLYRKYGHCYDAFKLAISDPGKIFADIKIDADIVEALLRSIERRLTPQAIKIRADIEVTCFTYEGIDAIKSALKAGEELSTGAEHARAADESDDDVLEEGERRLRIRLVAPPLYVMTMHSYEKQAGIQVMEKAISRIEDRIKKSGGGLVVKMKPRAVTATDDAELANLLGKVENGADGEESENSEEESEEDDNQ